MFSTHFRALRDHNVYITMFKKDGLGLADHEHWGMSTKSTHLVLDYSATLKISRLHEEASVALCILWVGEWHGQVLADCGFGFEAQFMNEEDNGKR